MLVHCFHGINRTGTLLCMHPTIRKKLGVSMLEMIRRFETARGAKIQYDFIHEFLHGQEYQSDDESDITDLTL